MSKDTYTHGHHASVLQGHTRRTAQDSAAYLLPHLNETMRMLDVGCGPATITCDLAALVDHVTAIEPVEGILETARATARERAVDNVSFEVGSVYDLAFDDDTFDVTHAHQVLQHLTDPPAAIAEMMRVTKPGGIVAVRDADYHAMSWHPQPPELDRWMEIYQSVARRNDAEPDAARHLIEWALDAGVPSTAITPSMNHWLYASAAERTYWANMWAERTVHSAFGEQARDYQISTMDEQLDIATGWREWAEHLAGWFTVPHGELLLRQ